MRNRYGALQLSDVNEINYVEAAYKHFVKAHKVAAESMIPNQEKTKQNLPCENEII